MFGFKCVAVPEGTREIGPYFSAWTPRAESVLPYSLNTPTVNPLQWIFYLDLAAPVSHVASLLLPTQRMAVLLVESDAQTILIERVVKRVDAERYGEYWRAKLQGIEPPGMDLGLVMPHTFATPSLLPLRVLWRAVWKGGDYGQWEALGNALDAARGTNAPEVRPVGWLPVARA